MAPLLLLFLLPVLLLLAAADAFPASCPNTTCGDLDIHYPFWLNKSTSDCGYPGLGLVCENTTLILPVKSHRYRVRSIDYQTHTLVVSDADVNQSEFGCPRLHVNLSIDYASSWLQLTQSDSNITFLYNCKKTVSLTSVVDLGACDGSDGKRSYVLPDGELKGAEAYEYQCDEVVVAPVLDMHKKAIMDAAGSSPTNASIDTVVKAGFELFYNSSSYQCGRCESSGGWCGYQRNETHGGMKFTCFCDNGPTPDRCAR